MTTPSTLLLRYFETAQQRLRQLTDNLGEAASSPLDPNLSWHRSRIVEAQLSSLDDAISEWQGHNSADPHVSREIMQSVLRQIGTGDFSCVSFDDGEFTSLPLSVAAAAAAASSTGLRSRSPRGSGDGEGGQQIEHGFVKDTSEEQKSLLTEAVEQTNEVARQAFARSVLIFEWRNPMPQYGRELRGIDEGVEEASVLEYCGLMMAGIRLPEIQQYLQDGTAAFVRGNSNPSEGDSHASSVEDRLLHMQKLYWRALGWDPNHALDKFKNYETNNPEVMETLTKYSSIMTVAATNAAMSSVSEGGNENNDDGTTRVVGVSYSEKIISYTNSGDISNSTSQSLSAPESNTIDEHENVQQRQNLDVAQKTSLLQQQLWNDHMSSPPHEQLKTITKAKIAHRDFLDKITNTPPGMERVLVMQNMDGEVQKLLVIYKLWCSQNPGAK